MELKNSIRNHISYIKAARKMALCAKKRGSDAAYRKFMRVVRMYEQELLFFRELQERRKQPRIVQCRQCKYYNGIVCKYRKNYWHFVAPKHFCGYGKRKKNAERTES